MRFRTWIFLILMLCFSCSSQSHKKETTSESDTQELVAGKIDSQKKVVCFIYHRFGDSRYPSTNISILHFKAHLQYLKEQGFSVLTLRESIDYLKSDEDVKKVAVITIDDGYKSFFDNGFPLLKEFGFPATLFINTESVGGSTYMSWNEISEVNKSGIEIGNHTHSHAFFLDIPKVERYKQFEEELMKSQEMIDENLGEKPVVFAYPYGEFDPEMKLIVKKVGFRGAVAQNSGVIHPGSDVYALPRFPMSTAYSGLEKFKEKANMHPLRLESEKPESFLLPDKNKPPVLNISFHEGDLQTSQIQCFVQGGKCTLDMQKEGGLVSLTLRAESPLKARRTLYTVTVPSKTGEWHWFSHLWINPEVPGE